MTTRSTGGLLTVLGETLSSMRSRIDEQIAVGRTNVALAQREIDRAMAHITRITSAPSFAGLKGLRSAAPQALAVLGAAMCGSPARAQPLNPLEFASLGTLDIRPHPGSHFIDTDALTFSGPGINNPAHMVHGVVRGSTAVFCFDDMTVASGTTIVVGGHRPLALLSKTNAIIGGLINARAQAIPGSDFATVGVAGGGSAGIGGGGSLSGGQGGGIGGGSGGSPDGLHPSGGSFGGGLVLNQQNAGGPAYGNLLLRLEGGSGGGGAWTGTRAPDVDDSGGAGGGAIEIGATWWMTISANITARGGDSARGGAGSGGAVLLHAVGLEFYDWEQTIDVSGGTSNSGFNGAGGRVVIQSHYRPDLDSVIVASGGPGALAGVVTAVHTAVSVPQTLDFGSVPVGTTKTLFINVQNAGDPDSVISGQCLTDPDSPFTLVGSNSFTGLRSGSTCGIAYSFTPQVEGDVAGFVYIYSDGNESAYVQLHGTGGNACESADINGDGDVGTDADIEAFFRVLAGGHC